MNEPSDEVRDELREFLRERGCPERVVERGLEGLLASWAMTVDEVSAGYRFGLDDYRNDVDARQLIEEALPRAQPPAREAFEGALAVLDERIEPWLSPLGPCLWGDDVAREHGWTPARNWWYFRWPAELS